MNFKDIAHKTVAELFDMLKAKEAAIQEMDEVIKLQDTDLRKYEKQIDELKAKLNNMEACYIGKKKQVEAANTVLINWQDEYTEHTHQHECATDAVLRTCIAELRQALRGAND